jgi:predicted nucleic acid-binding protein
MTYLLDTDIAIELLRGRNVQVAEQLASRDRNAVFLSSVREFGRVARLPIEDWAATP